jgi:hypothetical protein
MLIEVARRLKLRTLGKIEPVALVVSQGDGDRIFIVADKLIESTVGLVAERFAGATYRDAFAFPVPRNIDLVGWNAVEICKGALDGLVVDVGPVHLENPPFGSHVARAPCPPGLA